MCLEIWWFCCWCLAIYKSRWRWVCEAAVCRNCRKPSPSCPAQCSCRPDLPLPEFLRRSSSHPRLIFYGPVPDFQRRNLRHEVHRWIQGSHAGIVSRIFLQKVVSQLGDCELLKQFLFNYDNYGLKKIKFLFSRWLFWNSDRSTEIVASAEIVSSTMLLLEWLRLHYHTLCFV